MQPHDQLTPQQIQSFHENGFIVIDNAYTSQELRDFHDILVKLIQAWLGKASRTHPELKPEKFSGRELDDGIVALKALDTSFIGDIYDTLAQAPEFLRIISKREVSAFANQLLGRSVGSPLYTFTCRCRIDPPLDTRRTYGWHQEVFYTIPESKIVQTWAPLVRNLGKREGTIEVKVGSHKAGIPRQSWEEPQGKALQILADPALLEPFPSKVVEMSLGQLLIFDGRLFHQSGSNTSDQVRYSLVGMYHDIDQPNFRPPAVSFSYKGKTPRQYYEEMMALL